MDESRRKPADYSGFEWYASIGSRFGGESYRGNRINEPRCGTAWYQMLHSENIQPFSTRANI